MKSDAELFRLAATEIMGWSIEDYEPDWWTWHEDQGYQEAEAVGPAVKVKDWNPLTPEHSDLLLQKKVKEKKFIKIYYIPGDRSWLVAIGDKPLETSYNDPSLQRAILISSLLDAGVDVE
jgi:hypothetical protein